MCNYKHFLNTTMGQIFRDIS